MNSDLSALSKLGLDSVSFTIQVCPIFRTVVFMRNLQWRFCQRLAIGAVACVAPAAGNCAYRLLCVVLFSAKIIKASTVGDRRILNK